MLQIVNCLQCGRPLQKRGQVQVCKRCVEEESKVYDFYYNKIGRQVHQLNYKYIAQRGHIDENRLKETCLYRMSNTKHELEGWKKGSCNTCCRVLPNPDSFEPICIRCLEHVLNMVSNYPDTAILEEYQHLNGEGEAPKKQSLLDKVSPNKPSYSTEEADYKKLYEKTLGRLEEYETQYGSLGSAPANPLAPTKIIPTSKMSSDSKTKNLRVSSGKNYEDVSNSADAEDILSILEEDEDNLIVDALESSDESENNGGLKRRFGFKNQAS